MISRNVRWASVAFRKASKHFFSAITALERFSIAFQTIPYACTKAKENSKLHSYLTEHKPAYTIHKMERLLPPCLTADRSRTCGPRVSLYPLKPLPFPPLLFLWLSRAQRSVYFSISRWNQIKSNKNDLDKNLSKHRESTIVVFCVNAKFDLGCIDDMPRNRHSRFPDRFETAPV